MLAIYNFDRETRVYTGPGWALPCQLVPGDYHVPAYATKKVPPDAPTGQQAAFDVAADEWALQAIPAVPVQAGETVPLPVELTFEERLTVLQDQAQSQLDVQAQSMGYDDIRTAVTYADEDADPVFQAEGRALRAWRSKFWRACYVVLGAVTSGDRAEPSWAELLAELPAFEMPAEPESDLTPEVVE